MCWSLASESGGMGVEEGIGVSNGRSTNVVRGIRGVKRVFGICSDPTKGFQRRLLVLCCALQGGLQVEVGDETVQIVGMEAEEFSSLGKAALRLFQGGEDEMFLGVAHSLVEFAGGFGNGQCAVGQSLWKVFGKNQVRGAGGDCALDG